MKKIVSFQRLTNISIAKKLYFIVGTMAVLIAIELLTLWFAIHTLSSVRALVGAEGLWSKAEKDAAYHLRKYNRTHNEEDYKAFHSFMAVPMGDHKTRIELSKANPDFNIARQGFIEGRIHPDDIDGMINLIRRFHSISYIEKAINYWAQGDSIIASFIPIADSLHREINSENPSKEKLDYFISLVDPINNELTLIEDNFSYTLGEGSRWLENLILKLLFFVALTVEITGLVMSMAMSKAITKGLNEINNTAQKIKHGDLSARALIFSKDEIGKVGVAMNEMTEQLVRSNKELGHFAYIASHDLQEPLRTITNYVGLFKEQYQGKIDADADVYLNFISNATSHMQALIKDLLEYSLIGHDKKKITIDCNQLMKVILNNMASSINESKADIYYYKLPEILAFPEVSSLFQNLISNSIKYRKEDTRLMISISGEEKADGWLFEIKDNGIGIEKKYQERVFEIFQKLHSREQYPGTGIGLAHCKKIVELHGGKIWVESSLNNGTTVLFTIPKFVTV